MLNTSENINIERNKALRPSQDYYFLRDKGMAFIRQLAGQLWTDHNSHDPGITLMELLCYALTDLGYRTDFKMADLLMEPDNEPFEESGLFPAHEILTTCPVTMMDYRELLLKLRDVRNAWLVPRRDFSEVPLFVDCGKKQLTFETLKYQVPDGPLKDWIFVVKIGDHEQLPFPQGHSFKIHSLEDFSIKKISDKEIQLGFTLHYSMWSQRQRLRFEALDLRVEDTTGLSRAALIELLADTSDEGLLGSYFQKQQGLQLARDWKPVKLNGLYDVLLELEVDPRLGALTERALSWRITHGDLKGVVVKLDFSTELDFSNSIENLLLSNFQKDSTRLNWTFDARITAAGTDWDLEQITLTVINNKPRSNENPINLTAAKLKAAIQDATLPGGEVRPGLLALFWEKQKRRQEIIDRVCCVLQAHRNLCEDFHAIKTVPAEQVAICVDIETRNEADLEVLYASIIYAIENYFNPPIRYYSLSELLADGYTADQIFDGPFVDTNLDCGGEPVFVKAGFVKTDDLQKSELRKTIYASDLINILMDFEGVLSVKNLQLRKYDTAGNTSDQPFKWCLEIEEGHQPVFDLNRSKFLFFKNEIPYTAKVTETLDQLNFLRQSGRKAAYVEPNQTLAYPKGRYRNLHEYFPLQYDLPDNYGVGEGRLPLTAPTERIAAAKQLKGYLQFYEQVFADYLQQLMQARRLLSIDNTLSQTYFSKYLKDFVALEKADGFEEEYYLPGQYDPAEPTTYFLENDRLRQSFYESKEKYQKRRNRFLDHLLARFGEQFTDYTLMLFSLDGDRLATGEELIQDKLGFLRELPSLSRSRFQAFNYQPEDPVDIWDADNIAGIKKRIGRLMGIRDLSRRDLHCTQLRKALVKRISPGGEEKVRFKVSNKANDFFISAALADVDAAKQMRNRLRRLIGEISTYEIEESGGRWFLHLVDVATGEKLTYQTDYPTRGDAQFRLRQILASLEFYLQSDTHPLNGSRPFCGSREKEGFYLFEHILFRPVNDWEDELLMKICPPDDCAFCGDEDPYSFRISVVLPYWTGRFKDMDFRHFFERTIREEIPAHIHVKICWIGNEQMEELDRLYKTWLELKQEKKPDAVAYNQALQALIALLEQLQTIYPQATLHDCEEDGGDRPVRLGNTGLGIF